MARAMKNTNSMMNKNNVKGENNMRKGSLMEGLQERLIDATKAPELETSVYQTEEIEAIINKIYKGEETLDELLAVKVKEIDFSKCLRKINTIQRIYKAGSAVGACTVVAGNMYLAELDEKNMEYYKKALKMLKDREAHVPYGESIWVEGYNKFTEFRFETGHYYVYYVVTNEEIRMLEKKIKGMDYSSTTLEDLLALQRDLPPFIRSWQESSIDCAKDKEKVFDKNYDEFFKKIDVISTFLKSNMEEIKLNLDVVKDLHRAGKRNFKFEISLPLTDNVLPDKVGKVSLMLKETTEDFYNNQLAPLYALSNRDFFKQFANACEKYPELALYINQVFTFVKQSFNDEAGLSKDQYALLRNAIYTKAAEYGVEDMSKVVEIAISVAMRYVQLNDKEIKLGVANVDKFRTFIVQHIFESEFEVLRTGEPMVEELELVYVEKGIEITEGDTVEFVNGVSTYGVVEVEGLFTGTAYNKGGKLVHNIDVYAYEEVKSVVTVETYKEGTPAKELQNNETRQAARDNGEYTIEYFEQYDVISVAGKNANVLANGSVIPAMTVSSPALKGNYAVSEVLYFEATENNNIVFFIVLA